MQLATSTSSSSLLQLARKRKRETEETQEPLLQTETRRSFGPYKRKYLRIEIPAFNATTATPELASGHDQSSALFSGLSEPDSLFDESPTLTSSRTDTPPIILSAPRLSPALLTAPQIPGLFFTPTLRLPEDVADAVTRYCLATYFQGPGVNQVMLFGRLSETPKARNLSPSIMKASPTGLPSILLSLISTLDALLLPILPPQTHSLLFPRTPGRARQAILNLYQPGEGISPHVDLLGRFGDGIIGVSLGSGCVMQFAKAGVNDQANELGLKEREQWDVYLPERSVIVLSEEARYQWTHGIGKHREDYVSLPDPEALNGRWIERGLRLSITFRWLLPGADIVGDDGPVIVAT